MKWIMLFVLAFATVARAAESPADELIRLRKENAAMKAEIAKLKEELAAAKPAAPKATKYTPASLVKLIPSEQIPADGKWDGPHVSKAKKIVGAVLIGEWVQIDLVVQRMESNEEGKSNVQSKWMPVNAMSVFVDAKFSTVLKPAPAEGRTLAVIGKVRQVEINNSMPAAPVLNVVLEESRVAK